MPTNPAPDFGPGPWGLHDNVDRCWMGNDSGPIVCDDLEIARCAAAVLNERFGYFARIMPKTYDERADRLRDRQTPPLSFEEALTRLEKRVR